MKKLMRTFLVAVCFFCLSCTVYGGIPQKLDSFVAKTEKHCAKYSKQDWEQSRKEYRALVDEYDKVKDQLSDADKDTAIRAMERYSALMIKNGIVAGAAGVKEFGAMLPGYLEGLAAGLDANAEEISKALKSLVDTNKINSAFESLGNALEKITGGKNE